jgi:hypothetical protein
MRQAINTFVTLVHICKHVREKCLGIRPHGPQLARDAYGQWLNVYMFTSHGVIPRKVAINSGINLGGMALQSYDGWERSHRHPICNYGKGQM